MEFAQQRDRKKFADVGVAVGLAAAGMAVGVVAAVILLDLTRVAGVEMPDSIANVVLMFALQVVGLAGTAAVYMSVTDRGLGYIRLRTPSLKQVGIAVGSVFGMLLAVVVISLFIEALGTEAAEHGTVDQIEQDPRFALYMVPLAILVIGPCEELLFRGVIQTRLLDSFDKVGAIGITSVVFAVIHVPAYGGLTADLESLAVTLSVLFTLSVILGYIYERTDNLTVPIIAHGFYNATLFGIVYIGAEYGEEFEEAATVIF